MMRINESIEDRIYEKYSSYNSFENARGVRRSKGVEWAAAEIQGAQEFLLDFDSSESLLLKLGWNTFMGFGLYCGVLSELSRQESAKYKELMQQLKTLLNDIVLYTNVGHIIAFNVQMEEMESIDFARIDNKGNIFIYPSDTEELNEIVTNLMYG